MEKAPTRKANHARRVKVVGSNPADLTMRGTGPAGAKILNTLWSLKKEGQSEDTLKAKGHRLRFLAKHVNLDDPEAVKGYIANQSRWSNAYKQGMAYAYNSYVQVNGLGWNLPHLRIEDRLPKIPTEDKINQLIVRGTITIRTAKGGAGRTVQKRS